MVIYTEQAWADGDATKPLSALRMQHLEDGLAAVEAALTTLITAAATTAGNAVPASQKGAALGVATLGSTGTVLPAQIPFGTTSTTVAAGNDSRLSGALQVANALSELTSNAAAARTNLGLSTGATASLATQALVLPTVGQPANTVGLAGDLAVDFAAEVAYQNIAGTWTVLASFGGSSGGGGVSSAVWNKITGTAYSLALSDKGKWIYTASASATTITIPTHAAVAFSPGDSLRVFMGNTGVCTIAHSAVTVRLAGTDTNVLSVYQICELTNLSTDEWLLTIV